MDFANLYLRNLLQTGGVYAQALRSMRRSWEESGCAVTMLMNRSTEDIAKLTCDLMETNVMRTACGVLRSHRTRCQVTPTRGTDD